MSDLFYHSGSHVIEGPVGPLEVAAMAGGAEAPYSGRHAFALIAHPHPLHGGTMDNKVVTTLARAYRDLGLPVLRFNFRGVGQSGGEYDHARGEVDDLLAVAAAGFEALPGARVLLAGFSFGSSVAARASYRLDCPHLTLVAPPVPRYEFTEGKGFAMPVCVLQGEADERVEEAAVRQWAKQLQGDVAYHRFADTGHFFHGRLPELKEQLGVTLRRQCPPEALQ